MYRGLNIIFERQNSLLHQVDYSATTSQKTTTTTTAIVLDTLNFDAKDSSIHAMYSIEDKLFVSFPCPVNDWKCPTIIAETFSLLWSFNDFDQPFTNRLTFFSSPFTERLTFLAFRLKNFATV